MAADTAGQGEDGAGPAGSGSAAGAACGGVGSGGAGFVARALIAADAGGRLGRRSVNTGLSVDMFGEPGDAGLGGATLAILVLAIFAAGSGDIADVVEAGSRLAGLPITWLGKASALGAGEGGGSGVANAAQGALATAGAVSTGLVSGTGISTAEPGGAGWGRDAKGRRRLGEGASGGGMSKIETGGVEAAFGNDVAAVSRKLRKVDAAGLNGGAANCDGPANAGRLKIVNEKARSAMHCSLPSLTCSPNQERCPRLPRLDSKFRARGCGAHSNSRPPSRRRSCRADCAGPCGFSRCDG